MTYCSGVNKESLYQEISTSVCDALNDWLKHPDVLHIIRASLVVSQTTGKLIKNKSNNLQLQQPGTNCFKLCK